MEVRRYYEEKEKIPYTETSILRLERSAKLGKEGLTLDIGCNGAYLRKHIKNKRVRYVGIDIASKWYNRSMENFCVSSATHLPFKDKCFDTVFALELVEHLFDYKPFLQDVRRVLKDDGVFILSTPNIACLVNRFKVLLGIAPSYFGKGSGHVNCFTYKTLKEALNDDGFRIDKREPLYVGIPPRRITLKLGLKYNQNIAKLFPNLNDNLLVRAVKRSENEV